MIIFLHNQIDALLRDCSISIANALEILQSCTKQSRCPMLLTHDLLKQAWDLCKQCIVEHQWEYNRVKWDKILQWNKEEFEKIYFIFSMYHSDHKSGVALFNHETQRKILYLSFKTMQDNKQSKRIHLYFGHTDLGGAYLPYVFSFLFFFFFFFAVDYMNNSHFIRHTLIWQAPSHYLNQWWPRLVTSKCVTRPQWVTVLSMSHSMGLATQPYKNLNKHISWIL